MLSNTTCRPSGDSDAKRGILVVKLGCQTSTTGRGGSTTSRVSLTRNGISARPPPSGAMRWILPPAQKIIALLSGSQSIAG